MPLAAREFVRISIECALVARQADGVERRPRQGARLRGRHGFVQANRLRDLIADPHQGIQRRHRFLENHADVAAPNALQLRFGHFCQSRLAQPHGTARSSLRRQQPHDAERGHGFSGSGRPYQPQDLAGADRERQLFENLPVVDRYAQ